MQIKFYDRAVKEILEGFSISVFKGKKEFNHLFLLDGKKVNNILDIPSPGPGEDLSNSASVLIASQSPIFQGVHFVDVATLDDELSENQVKKLMKIKSSKFLNEANKD